LTPTKQTGATAKPNEVLYVDPDCQIDDAALAETMQIEGMNAAFIADLLSAVLTHERCGRHLYRSVAERTHNPILQRKYEEFGSETERHVEILEELIAAAGGNPSFVSPRARAVQAADTKLVEATFLGSGSVDLMTAEMAMLDAVFIAESVDHANWQTMRALGDELPEGALRSRFQAACQEVESQEDEHLGWAHDMRARMTMMHVKSTTFAKVGMKAEEMVAAIRGWFAD